jgi:hypothetical protein
MNASSLTLSTFDHCQYQLGHTDAPQLKARGVIQLTMTPDAAAAVMDVTLVGSRRHQRVMVAIPMAPADIDGMIRQLQGVRDMLRTAREGQHGA